MYLDWFYSTNCLVLHFPVCGSCQALSSEAQTASPCSPGFAELTLSASPLANSTFALHPPAWLEFFQHPSSPAPLLCPRSSFCLRCYGICVVILCGLLCLWDWECCEDRDQLYNSSTLPCPPPSQCPLTKLSVVGMNTWMNMTCPNQWWNLISPSGLLPWVLGGCSPFSFCISWMSGAGVEWITLSLWHITIIGMCKAFPCCFLFVFFCVCVSYLLSPSLFPILLTPPLAIGELSDVLNMHVWFNTRLHTYMHRHSYPSYKEGQTLTQKGNSISSSIRVPTGGKGQW